MKTVTRLLGRVAFLAVLLLVTGLVYSTAKGYMTWYFRVNGTVSVNGQKTNGYLHANTARTVLLVTRTDATRPETYLLMVKDHGTIIDCGNWHPIRFLPAPIGDLSPPCSGFDTPSGVSDGPTSSALITSRRSVEFTTASGKKIKAEW